MEEEAVFLFHAGYFVNVCLWDFASVIAARYFGRFSNRPFGVKRFQTFHHCSVDVARGLVLLFGIGTTALPSWDSKTRRINLMDGLAIRRINPSHALTSFGSKKARSG
jgi:hypothetical protein